MEAVFFIAIGLVSILGLLHLSTHYEADSLTREEKSSYYRFNVTGLLSLDFYVRSKSHVRLKYDHV
ncbi:hypothetical protein GCM10020331_013820 [Ectobacillus funiculus]